MSELYVVVYMVGGWAREDEATPNVAGAYTDASVAAKVARACHGTVIKTPVNSIKPGHLEYLKALGFSVPGFEDTEIADLK